MSATAVQAPQPTGICDKEWVKLFPKDVTENYTSSITFIKQLTVVAISTITYLKNVFPENSYSGATFGGLKLKLLKNKCEDDLARLISTSLKQSFEAFDKKYVNQLALCFYHGECSAENLVEYHVFEYTYTPEGVSLTLNSENRNSARQAMRCSIEAVKTRTARLVRALSLFIWQHCTQDLPVNFDISLRLYYNEDAPEGYQAPGFCPPSGPDHLADTAARALCHGAVETPFHKFIARSFSRDVYYDSEADVPSDNQPEMTQDSEGFDGRCARSPDSRASADCQSQDSRASANGRTSADSQALANGRTSADSQALANGRTSADSKASANGRTSADSQASAAPALRCPCTKTDADEDLVTCKYCHTQQHATCFGLLGPVAEHCCTECAALRPAHRASCRLLVGLERRKQESLCIFRRALMLCSRQAALCGEELMERFGLTASSASKILRLLQTYYVLPHADPQDLEMPRKINSLRVKLAFKRLFREKEQDNRVLVDRLIDDMEQENSDPVGDVLSPLEKVTLHNSSNLGNTCHTVAPPTIPEPILQQYRSVLVPDEVTEQLPLSGDHNPVKDVERVNKKSKRKIAEEDEEWTPTKLSKLRSGVIRTNKKRI